MFLLYRKTSKPSLQDLLLVEKSAVLIVVKLLVSKRDNRIAHV